MNLFYICFPQKRKRKKIQFSSTQAWTCESCYNINRHLGKECLLCNHKNKQRCLVPYHSIPKYL